MLHLEYLLASLNVNLKNHNIHLVLLLNSYKSSKEKRKKIKTHLLFIFIFFLKHLFMTKDDPITLYCLNILSREDVKTKIKCLFTPIIDMILIEVYPYILISILFICISFFLILANLILLIRFNFNNNKINNI